MKQNGFEWRNDVGVSREGPQSYGGVADLASTLSEKDGSQQQPGSPLGSTKLHDAHQ